MIQQYTKLKLYSSISKMNDKLEPAAQGDSLELRDSNVC